jgi:hypothetical protein
MGEKKWVRRKIIFSLVCLVEFKSKKKENEWWCDFSWTLGKIKLIWTPTVDNIDKWIVKIKKFDFQGYLDNLNCV